MIYLVVYEKDEMVNVEKFTDIIKAEDKADELEQYPLVILRKSALADLGEHCSIEGEIVHIQNQEDFQELNWKEV